MQAPDPHRRTRRHHHGCTPSDGRPALDQTLNRLSHLGTPMRVVSDDPLKRDLFFRYNQSLQEFVNASAAFPTAFAR